MHNLTQSMIEQLALAWQRFMTLAQRGLMALTRFYNWWQSINWPQIPLRPIQWVLLFFVVFGLIYAWATPPFEASDELWHFGMARVILETGELPVQDPNEFTPWRQEGSQPPLYYAIAAGIMAPFDLSDADQYLMPNPHAQAGVPGQFGNKNLVLHDDPPPPLEGTPLAVYAVRSFGILLGAITVWLVYRIGLILSPQRPIIGLVAAGITALNPMFLFIAASINNDNLVTTLNAGAILLMLITLRDGFDWKRSLGIAILVALGTLTKLSALVLVPVIALSAIWLALRNKDWRGLMILGGAMLVFWAVIAGWWYVRNVQLYGELFGTATMAAVAGPRIEPFSVATLFSEAQGFRFSYWGVFGAFNIQASPVFYALMDMLVFIAIIGVTFLVLQLIAIRDFSYARRELTSAVFLLSILLVGLLAFISWTAQTYASQGRLLFPFIGAISPLLAAGLVEMIWWFIFVLSPPDRSFVRAGEAVSEGALQGGSLWPLRFLGLAAVLIPFTIIAPQYEPPQPIDALPSDVNQVYARYGDIELVAYERNDRRYLPGEGVPITLYWRVLETSDRDYTLSLGLVDPAGQAIGKIDSYPGAGTLRTSQWEPGRIYPDHYVVDLAGGLDGRYPFRAQIGWWLRTTGEDIQPLNMEGQPLEAVMLDVGAMVDPITVADDTGFTPLDEDTKAQADFDGIVRLATVDVDLDAFTFALSWEVTGPFDGDYAAFVHILDENGQLVGQSDVYPTLPTRYWRYGELYITEHAVSFNQSLEPGTYQVNVGWYLQEGEEFFRLTLPPLPPEEDAEPLPAGEEPPRPDALHLFDVVIAEDGSASSETLETWRDAVETTPEPGETSTEPELEGAPPPPNN